MMSTEVEDSLASSLTLSPCPPGDHDTVEDVGSGILRRQVYGENVERVEVGGGGVDKAEKVQGTLFIPDRPGPGVLCLTGAGGVRVSAIPFKIGIKDACSTADL